MKERLGSSTTKAVKQAAKGQMADKLSVIFGKGQPYLKGQNPGNYSPVSLISVHAKIMKRVRRKSQHGFGKDKSCLTWVLLGQMTGFVDKERAARVIYLNFCKTKLS